ncbi:cuticle protein 21.3-like [Tribolium madens]|uniref:cuticle protein 21.3-like n=1 Tax=Tribolium madens TaxID=41895 RepID=UPI001CF72E00|nr:cuticle protein 21.3-like [Tribolium madens]XP_044255074.1 cuticle protein 21.3-like [Tribolium madens]
MKAVLSCINTRVDPSINQTSNRITMNFQALIALFAVVSATNASVIGLGGIALAGPAAPGVVLKGPAAEATIAGSDGSAIAAAAQAGTIAAAPKIGGVVTAAVTPGLVAAAAPVAIAAPVGAVLAGPSGTVISNAGIGAIAAPALIGGRTIIAGPALGLGLTGKLI